MSSRWWWDEQWGSFRTPGTPIRIAWDGGSCTARLFDAGVPETSAAFRAALPLEIPLVHVAWSGDMLMGARKLALGVEREENRTRLPRPGDIAFDPKYDELTITYGTAECRLPSGENTICVFGAIESMLDEFAAWARGRRFEGVGSVTISAA